MAATKEKTYWNGEPTPCRRVRVVVGKSPVSTWWCASLEGTERNAVEVNYGGELFYLDDDEYIAAKNDPVPPHSLGVGWWKVTVGQGGPENYHADLPVARVLRELS